jgi:hypothetical protein
MDAVTDAPESALMAETRDEAILPVPLDAL